MEGSARAAKHGREDGRRDLETGGRRRHNGRMSQDANIVVCAGCGGKNRVAVERLGDGPKCGKCGQALPPPSAPVDLDDTSFDAVVTRAGVPVFVDFWAPWCGPCRAFTPVVAEYAKKAAGRAIVAKVNVDECPRTAAKFGVQGIPTVILFRGGREVARRSGAMPLSALEKFAESA
jgi:thioredoxin 2